MRGTWGLLLLFLAGFVWQLKEEWALNPHYFYSWGVPILGIILFLRRWAERPPIDAPTQTGALVALGVILLLCWLPLRVVREANMDWRFVQWLIGAGCVACLLGTFFWMGGKAWLRHFAFPVLFLLLAVPWPTRLEALLIQNSTGVVVRAVVEVLRWCGIAAWNAGNVIQLPSIAVGVDEACSGLRSLQGAVMCGLFFGELFRLSRIRRTALLATAAVCALALNTARTLILTLVAHARGDAAVSFWHDSTGLLTLVLVFALLAGFARLLRQPALPAQARDEPFRFVPVWVLAGCAAWLVFVEAANVLWFRLHETAPPKQLWTFQSRGTAALRKETIPARTQAILRYNSGEAYRRRLADGTQWWIYALAWKRDGGGSPLARFHSPEVCLPAAGLKIASEGRPLFPIGEQLAFRSYEIEWLGHPVYLFSSFASSSGSGPVQNMAEFDLDWRKRLRLALSGTRPAEQKVFQLLISGAASRRAAEEAFLTFAAETLHLGR